LLRRKQKKSLVKHVVKGRIEENVSLPKTKRSIQPLRVQMLYIPVAATNTNEITQDSLEFNLIMNVVSV